MSGYEGAAAVVSLFLPIHLSVCPSLTPFSDNPSVYYCKVCFSWYSYERRGLIGFAEGDAVDGQSVGKWQPCVCQSCHKCLRLQSLSTAGRDVAVVL